MTDKPETHAKPQPCRIMALDGGGVRGLVTAVWLSRIEAALGKPICERLDLIAGSSTGAILACGLGLGMPAAELVRLYRDHAATIFPSGARQLWRRLGRIFTSGLSHPKYSDAGLAEVLRAKLGPEVNFGAMKVPTLVTAYDTLNRRAMVFKSFREEYANLPAWELAKASSSAPTYFPAHVLHYRGADLPLIDGGVVANNPTACAIAEAIRLNEAQKTGLGLADFHVISLGTGELTDPISIRHAREWGTLEWARPVIDVLLDGATDSVSYIARQLIPDDQYIRLQTRLDHAFDAMDDAGDANLGALIAVAEAWLESPEGTRAFNRAVHLLGG